MESDGGIERCPLVPTAHSGSRQHLDLCNTSKLSRFILQNANLNTHDGLLEEKL